jgi:hypothetical protein
MKPRPWLLAGLAAISFLLGGCGAKEVVAKSQRAVVEFHEQYDQRDFAALYAATDSSYRQKGTEKEFTDYLESMRRTLGTVQRTKEVGWTMSTKNSWTTVTLTYETKFAKEPLHEVFIFRQTENGVGLISYSIKPLPGKK